MLPAQLKTEDETGHERVLAALRVLVVAAFAVYAAFFVYHGIRVAVFPYDLDNGEAYLLNQADRIARGQSPYQPIEEPPYLIANYPPLYPALLALPVKLSDRKSVV